MKVIVLLLLLLDRLSGEQNIVSAVLEQDPRRQDQFYRNPRAGGMPIASINSVVHNVKHRSEGRFIIWDDIPSAKLRTDYTTTTLPPPTTTTIPWVRGRPRAGAARWRPDFDEVVLTTTRAPRRRRPQHRPRRPPPQPPQAPVRVKVGALAENQEPVLADDFFDEEDDGFSGREYQATKKAARTTPRAHIEEQEEVEDEEDVDAPFRSVKKDEGIDLDDLKKDGTFGVRESPGEGVASTKKDFIVDAHEGTRVAPPKKIEVTTKKPATKKSEKKKEKKEMKEKKETSGEEDENDEEEEKEEKEDSDESNEKEKGKDKGKTKGKAKEKEKPDKNGKLKKVDGDVRVPKAIDGETENSGEDDDEDEEEEDDRKRKTNKKKKKKRKKGKKRGKKRKDEGEEDYEEEDEDEEEDDDEDAEEEGEDDEESDEPNQKKSKTRGMKKAGHKCTSPKSPSGTQMPARTNQAPYPNGFSTMAPFSMTTSPSKDDYHDLETMPECGQSDEEEEKPKNERKKTKKDKKRSKKKRRKGSSRSMDYLTSREKVDQNRRNKGGILDELHANEDLKKLKKTTPDGMDCATAVDEFPLKCEAWKTAGFCETNTATQFLWCRRTCACSKQR